MLAALAFLTPLPVPGRRGDEARLGPGTLLWFPLVGALVGLAVGGAWWGAAHWWAPGVAAAIAVVADLVLTGALHADGLADSGDGLVPPLTRARRLEVMADPAVGAFGATALVAVLLLRWAALAGQPAQVAAVVGLWAMSRTIMAVALAAVPYARAGGLAQVFRGASARPVAALGGIVAGAAVVLGAGPPGLVALAAAVLAGAGVVALAVRRLGGFTGDVLGAAGLVAETVGLVALAANP